MLALVSFYHENPKNQTDFHGSGAIPVLRIRLVFSLPLELEAAREILAEVFGIRLSEMD
jgi:hypothetical protein